MSSREKFLAIEEALDTVKQMAFTFSQMEVNEDVSYHIKQLKEALEEEKEELRI